MSYIVNVYDRRGGGYRRTVGPFDDATAASDAAKEIEEATADARTLHNQHAVSAYWEELGTVDEVIAVIRGRGPRR